jgi:pyruvate formate lyase activating enzyme
MRAVCGICPHRCAIEEGRYGLCRARKNEDGAVICANYGKLTALALDPIEKKPLYRFRPGSLVLSAGSFGCNLSCPFCQNCDISMADDKTSRTTRFTPEELADKAEELRPRGNIGLAYTYNEPLVGYEFVRDTAQYIRTRGMANVIVTNGYINEQPLIELLPLIDAMNIDLKGCTDVFYKKLGGDLETVKRTIELSSKSCHVEVTTLIIPGENDGEDEIDAAAGWLAGLSRDIPLHLTRFFRGTGIRTERRRCRPRSSGCAISPRATSNTSIRAICNNNNNINLQ